jgi:serine/threonine-protein kinase SRPK3
MLPFEDSDVLATYIRRQEFIPAPYRERNGRRVYESRSDFGRLRKSVDFVKLTDFGLAVRADGSAKLTHDIQPREYTAPEVMLKAEWTYSADIWNLGLVVCIVHLVLGSAPVDHGQSAYSSGSYWPTSIFLMAEHPAHLSSRPQHGSLR